MVQDRSSVEIYNIGDVCKFYDDMSLTHTIYRTENCNIGKRIARRSEFFMVLEYAQSSIKVLLVDGPAYVAKTSLLSETVRLT